METQIKTEPEKMMRENTNHKITPFLWFDTQAEEAVNYYMAVFSDAKIKKNIRYGKEGAQASGMREGSVMTVDFQLEGQDFVVLNGGPYFKFTPAISFFVSYATPEEIDDRWNKLVQGGTVMMPLDKYPFSEKYGWLVDKYGVAWQFFLANEVQKIAPCLMFVGEQQGRAEEAITSYTSIFSHSDIIRMERYLEGEQGPKGAIKHAAFTLDGQKFIAMDGAIEMPFTFSLATSFVVNCETQAEIDYYWGKLTEGGDEASQQCGWLKDKFGVSWQIVPAELGELLNDPDQERSGRVMQAMLQMKKMDLEVLRKAYEQ